MTPLPAFDELIVERRDLPEYEIAPRCANPFCPNQAFDKHEIYPRSQAVGVVWWVELPGRFLIGNRVGLCRDCHQSNDAHTSQIIWDDKECKLAWIDFKTRDAGYLDPMPPIHKLVEPDVDTVIRQELEDPIAQPFEPPAQESETTEPVTTPVAGGPGEEEPGPTQQSADTGLSEDEPVPSPSPVSDIELLARRVRATDKLLQEIEESIPSVEEGPRQTEPEPVAQEEPIGEAEITPIVLPPEPELEVERGGGSDQAAIDAARRATELAQTRAEETLDVTGLGEFVPETGTRYHADLLIDPESLETEILAGDMRAKILIDEQIEKAKRAPKPRKPREPDDPNRPREPAKERRTWSISVPKEAREEGLLALGEDGYSEIEEGLETLRQLFGDSDDPGWKFRVLVKALGWMALNYTDEGE